MAFNAKRFIIKGMILVNDFLIAAMSVVYGLILLVGYTVYQNNKTRPAHKYFYALSIFFVLWLVSNSMQLVTEGSTSIFFLYADFAIAPWVAYSLFLFLTHVPHYRDIFRPLMHYCLLIPIAVCSVMVTLDLVIHSVAFNGLINISEQGPWYDVYSFILLGYVLAGLIALLLHIYKSKESERNQLILVLVSAGGVFGLLFVINLLFSSAIDNIAQLFLNNLSLAWLVIVGLAIKQHLFNLKTFSRELIQISLVILITTGLLSFYSWLDVMLEQLLSESIAMRILLSILAAPVLYALYNFLYVLAESFLEKKKTVVSYMNHDLGVISERDVKAPRDITGIIDNSIYQLLGIYPTWGFHQKGTWNLYNNRQIDDITKLNFDELMSMLSFQAEPFVASNLEKEQVPGGKKSRLVSLMRANNIEVVYPFYHTENENDRTVYGFLLLSSDSSFIGTQELSYISMMMPQITEQLYQSTLD